MSTATNVRELHRRPPEENADELQGLLQRWFRPRQETQMVTQQTRGVFLPYPLIAILVTVGALVLSGIIALEVQVSNLNTTLLLRDADARQQMAEQRNKIEQLEVYIHNDREKLVRIETELDKGKRRQ